MCMAWRCASTWAPAENIRQWYTIRPGLVLAVCLRVPTFTSGGCWAVANRPSAGHSLWGVVSANSNSVGSRQTSPSKNNIQNQIYSCLWKRLFDSEYTCSNMKILGFYVWTSPSTSTEILEGDKDIHSFSSPASHQNSTFLIKLILLHQGQGTLTLPGVYCWAILKGSEESSAPSCRKPPSSYFKEWRECQLSQSTFQLSRLSRVYRP